MSRARFAPACAILVHALVGCGDDNASPVGDAGNDLPFEDGGTPTHDDDAGADASVPVGGDAISLAEYAALFHAPDKAWEAWVAECCVPGAMENLYFPFTYTSEYDQDLIDNIQESIDAQRVAFHGEHAMQCARDQRAGYPVPPASCSTLDEAVLDAYYRAPANVPSSCEATFEGLSDLNAPCDRDMECKAGLRCNNTSGAFVCTPVGTVGSSCTFLEDCENGLWCVGRFGEGRCAASLGNIGSPCGTYFECSPGLACDVLDGTCFAPGGYGDPCSTSNDCGAGLTCDLNDQCVYAPLLANGQTCQDDYECESSLCNGGTCAQFCSP